jgi:hypothetical protein
MGKSNKIYQSIERTFNKEPEKLREKKSDKTISSETRIKLKWENLFDFFMLLVCKAY